MKQFYSTNPRYARQLYSAILPVCRVTPAMREEADALAKRKNVPLCEIQRRAMELLLSVTSEELEGNSEQLEDTAI